MELLAVQDLFVVGLGLDIAGAYLVARGLLASNLEIALRAAGYWGSSPPTAVTNAQNKVDGWIGLISLVLGFVLQAVGYFVILSGRADDEVSVGRALAAIGLGVAAILLVLGVWRRIRRPWLKRTLIEAARVDSRAQPPTFREHPFGGQLRLFGVAAGFEALHDETDLAYAQRVFDVDNVETGIPPNV